MTNQPLMPDSSVDQRLLSNLHRSCLEMEELGLQFDEVIARFDQEIRHQRLKRIKKSLSLFDDRSLSH
jgi:hypothetical protein